MKNPPPIREIHRLPERCDDGATAAQQFLSSPQWTRGQSFLVALVVVSLAAACDQQPQVLPQQQLNSTELRGLATADEPQADVRVVSLAPALTQMIRDIEKSEVLVGVAENDFAAPPQVRVVGNFMNINTEALVTVRPTHVVAMYNQSAPPDHLVRLARLQGFQLTVYRYPKQVSHVTQILYRPEDFTASHPMRTTPSIASIVHAPVAGRRIWLRMNRQLAALGDLTRSQPKPSVLMVFGTSPIIASGPGTVLDDLLGHCAGGRNTAAEASISAPSFDREKLLKLKPQVIVLLLPKDPPLESLDTDPRLSPFRGLPIPAVLDNRITLINDPLAVLPSSSLPRIAAAMAKAIHPNLATQIDEIMAEDPT